MVTRPTPEELAASSFCDEPLQQPPVVGDLRLRTSPRYDTSLDRLRPIQPLPLRARDPEPNPVELHPARRVQVALDEWVTPWDSAARIVSRDHERSALALRLRLLDEHNLDVGGLTAPERPLGRPMSVLSQHDADLGQLLGKKVAIPVEPNHVDVAVRPRPPTNVEVDGDPAAQPQRSPHLDEGSQASHDFGRGEHERHSTRRDLPRPLRARRNAIVRA